METWDKARNELVHSLREWGVQGEHQTHRRFRQRVFEEARRMFEARNSPPEYSPLKTNHFPTDYQKAVEIVYRSDIDEKVESCNRFLLDDAIGEMNISSQPFFRKYAKENNHFLGYRLKPEFKGIRSDYLDPFGRFQFPECTEPTYWYNRWFESTLDADAGIIFEARFACYALQHQPCYSCRCSRTLRWYGGSQASWQDLICIGCKSTYELKTKNTMETIEKNFRFNNIRGGSYERYCRLRNSDRAGTAKKMFLVLLPRKYTINKAGEKCHPVFIAEIDTVLPQVGPISFHPKINRMRLSSIISVKMLTKRHWFDLPKTEPIEYVEIMEHLFIERFSKEELKRQKQLAAASKDEEPLVLIVQRPEGFGEHLEGETRDKQESKTEEVERLKEELRNLKNGDDTVDDWEDMF